MALLNNHYIFVYCGYLCRGEHFGVNRVLGGVLRRLFNIPQSVLTVRAEKTRRL